MINLANGGMTFKGRYLFLMELRTNSTGVIRNKKIEGNKIKTDNNGRIIVIEAEIDNEIFFLINLFNPSTEAEQFKNLWELEQM